MDSLVAYVREWLLDPDRIKEVRNYIPNDLGPTITLETPIDTGSNRKYEEIEEEKGDENDKK